MRSPFFFRPTALYPVQQASSTSSVFTLIGAPRRSGFGSSLRFLRAAAARRKRREDPNPERRGAPINVRTEEVDEACWTGYKAVGLKKKGNRMVPNCVKEDETVTEKWTEKYKRSIDCDNPKGFSQRAHCQGKKKSVNEDGMGGAIGGSAGPTNVTGVATSTDPISATAVNRKKRKSPVMVTIRRKSPKV